MQSMAQLAEYKARFPGAEYHVITYNKRDAGRLYTCETTEEIRIIDITIIPAYQGKKISTFLLKQMIEKSIAAQKKLSLHVLPQNPALKLYQRFGFKIVRENGNHLYMERYPGGE
jgi:ribosomal protein S18 acetylase RimI-like enzyme